MHLTEVHEGIEIAYCDEGKGPHTLLFIHGLAGYLPVWKHQMHELKAVARCIAIDLPGNGLSSRGDYPFTMFFYAECVARFIEKMGLRNVVLCGHSMGGQVAIILALRYPQLLDKLVLVAPAGIEHFLPHEVMMMQQAMQIGDIFQQHEAHIETVVRQSFSRQQEETRSIISDIKHIMQAQPLRQWRHMSNASVMGMLNEQVNVFLPNITCKTLIIFGEQDHMIPNKLMHPGETTASVAKHGAAMIEHSELHLLPKAGHFVQIEQHAAVSRLIRDFIIEN